AIPEFSQHVFAISGVSGGAIGATIFQALARAEIEAAGGPPGRAVNAGGASASGTKVPERCARPPATPPPCSPPEPVTVQCSALSQAERYWAVVGAVCPQLRGASRGRADGLEGSFRNSVCLQDSAAADALGTPFVKHWSVHSRVPALMLNSTWVETGFRVAFAPFGLHETDESLYSFGYETMPSEDGVPLIKAAVVSARFPGILPPYSISMTAKSGELRWNFVDGGYSDSSGASTALALHRKLEGIAGDRAVIRVILLTSSNPAPDLSPQNVAITGTPFRDTLAPIGAVLKVREGLGNQAVARVCYHFYPNEDCKQKASDPE